MNPDLRALADEYWDYTLEKHPTSAHMLGDYRFMDRMEDASRAAEDADIAKQRDFAARARAFDSEAMSPSDLVTKETLLYEAETTAWRISSTPAVVSAS